MPLKRWTKNRSSSLGTGRGGRRNSRKKAKTIAAASAEDPESSSSHLLQESQTLPLHLQAQNPEDEEAPVQEQEEEEEEEEALDPEVCYYLDLQERKAWQTQRSLRIAIALIYQTVLQFPPEKILMDLMELLT